MKRILAVVVLMVLLIMSGCVINDGRTRIYGVWVVEDAMVQGQEDMKAEGAYLYMNFKKGGTMIMGTNAEGAIASFSFSPTEEGTMVMLQDGEDDEETWKFWFEDQYMMLQEIVEDDPNATPSEKPVVVGEDGEVHDHDEASPSEAPEENGAMKLMPLDEYIKLREEAEKNAQ